jgi:hypothetical protein
MITRLEDDKKIIFTFTVGNIKKNRGSLAMEVAS